MEAVNASVLLPPRNSVTIEQLEDNGIPHPYTKVDYHLNNLLATHLSNPSLTPQEIAELSRSAAAATAATAIAAKATRATADEKAATAAKAVAAAKRALDLIASFPNRVVFDEACLGRGKMKKHVAAELLYSKDEELLSKLQIRDVSQGVISNSSSSCEHKKRPNTENARVDFNGLGMELGSDRLVELVGGEGAKDGIQATRKRGRPKSK